MRRTKRRMNEQEMTQQEVGTLYAEVARKLENLQLELIPLHMWWQKNMELKLMNLLTFLK